MERAREGSGKTRPAALGMLAGIVLGSMVGLLFYLITGESMWLTAPGVGVALGLGVGAVVERRQAKENGS